MSTPRSRARLLRRSSAALGVLLVVLVLFTGYQALRAKSSLQAVASQLSAMTDSAASGDTAAAKSQLTAAAGNARTAYRNTRGPVWWAGEKLPFVGDDVTAVRTVADVANELTSDVLPDLVDAGSVVSSKALKPANGRIDLKAISDFAPALSRGASAIAASSARVDALATDGLLAQLKGPVVELQDKLARATRLTDAASTATSLMPSMLGQDGKRTYLLMFQNNAELRSTGGLTGALAVITADHGELALTGQSSPGQIGLMKPPLRGLTQEEKDLFTNRIAIYPQDTGINPHFPRAADLLSQMWRRSQGQRLDGVISVDPVALSYLLGATGPMRLPPTPGSDVLGVTSLTAANAVDTLLRDTYRKIVAGGDFNLADDQQNAFFAGVARSVFTLISGGGYDPDKLIDGLTRSVDERRLAVWSAHADEQRIIDPLALSDSVPDTTTPSPEIGFYLNDSGSDKLMYYLDQKLSVKPVSCGSTGQQVLHVTARLRSSVPKGPLPLLVVGPGGFGVGPGTMLLTSYLYAPIEGNILDVSVDGKALDAFQTPHRNRRVGVVTVAIPRGGERVLRYTVRTGDHQTGDPHILTTPLAKGTGLGTIGRSAC